MSKFFLFDDRRKDSNTLIAPALRHFTTFSDFLVAFDNDVKAFVVLEADEPCNFRNKSVMWQFVAIISSAMIYTSV